MKQQNLQYSVALAVADFIPVILFSISGIKAAQQGCIPMVLLGMGIVSIAGFCKAGWKLRLALGKTELRLLNKLFKLMLPVGCIVLLYAGIQWIVITDWKRIVFCPSSLLLVGFFCGMILMGIWAVLLDDSRSSTWIKEMTNIIAQGMLLWYIIG